MKIKVGGIFYDVLDVENLAEGTQRLDGHIEYGPSRINLNANLSAPSRTVVLWHEILHALLTQAGQKQLNENVMDALAYGIMQVVADNNALRPSGVVVHDGYQFCAMCGTTLGTVE